MARYSVSFWWQELHGDTIEIEAKSKKNALEKAKKIVEYLADSGYVFTHTYCDKGSYGVDEDQCYKITE